MLSGHQQVFKSQIIVSAAGGTRASRKGWTIATAKCIYMYMFLLRVTDALRKARVPYGLVGGYAVALHGAVRGTMDIDLVIRSEEAQFVRAERALRSIGLESRLPVTAREVYRFRAEYIRNRSLHAWSFVNPSVPSELVDVVLTQDLAELGTVAMRVQGRKIRVVALDDLIAIKQAAGRPQDLEDVRALTTLRGKR